MEDVLKKCGLWHFGPKFLENKLDDVDLIDSLGDKDLENLGLVMGERIRLRLEIRRHKERRNAVNNTAADATPTNHNRIRQLFLSTTRGNMQRSSRKRKSRTWTIIFFCLSDKNVQKVPSSYQKTLLQQNGLGMRKITFSEADTADNVVSILKETFPKLLHAGGFELLTCNSSTRKLEMLKCEWSIPEIKKHISHQTKIYIRPIQKDLETNECSASSTNELTEKCYHCGRVVSVLQLRDHVQNCEDSNNSITSVEPQDQAINSAQVDAGTPPTRLLEPATILNRQQNTENSSSRGQDDNEVSTFEPIIPDFPLPLDQLSTVHRPESLPRLSVPFRAYSNRNRLSYLGPSLTPTRGVPLHASSSTVQDISVSDDESLPDIQEDNNSIDVLVANVIQECLKDDVSNPVEILRSMQKQIVTGRKLEIEDVSEVLEGDTNLILVDRGNLLETALEEVGSLNDLRPTLKVEFYGEAAQGCGGPRKEFFRLVLGEIQRKYFDNDLRELLSEDYKVVGKIMALSILQNGPIPTIGEKVLDEIFSLPGSSSDSKCIQNLREGLDQLGIYQVGCKLPMFLHLMRKNNQTLTLRAVIHHLKPDFSEEGSNARKFEGAVYAAFMKYARLAAAGRRGAVSLRHILRFATGADEEPVLGYIQPPSIKFTIGDAERGFNPTANVCINALYLPRPTITTHLPTDEDLFSLYDYAFQNAYFGVV